MQLAKCTLHQHWRMWHSDWYSNTGMCGKSHTVLSQLTIIRKKLRPFSFEWTCTTYIWKLSAAKNIVVIIDKDTKDRLKASRSSRNHEEANDVRRHQSSSTLTYSTIFSHGLGIYLSNVCVTNLRLVKWVKLINLRLLFGTRFPCTNVVCVCLQAWMLHPWHF